MNTAENFRVFQSQAIYTVKYQILFRITSIEIPLIIRNLEPYTVNILSSTAFKSTFFYHKPYKECTNSLLPSSPNRCIYQLYCSKFLLNSPVVWQGKCRCCKNPVNLYYIKEWLEQVSCNRSFMVLLQYIYAACLTLSLCSDAKVTNVK